MFVYVQDWVRGGSGGSGGAGCWQPATNIDKPAMNVRSAERFKIGIVNRPISDAESFPVVVANVNPTLSEKEKKRPA